MLDALVLVRLVTRPSLALQQIAASGAWPLGFALATAVALITAAAWVVLTGSAPLPGVVQVLKPTMPPAWLMVGAALSSPLLLVITTGVIYVAGVQLGGRRAPGALLATQTFAMLPAILQVSAAVAGPRPGPDASVAVALSVVGQIWLQALRVIGVHQSLALSRGRALVALLLVVPVEVLLATSIGVGVAAATNAPVAATVPDPGADVLLVDGANVVLAVVSRAAVTLLAAGTSGVMPRMRRHR